MGVQDPGILMVLSQKIDPGLGVGMPMWICVPPAIFILYSYPSVNESSSTLCCILFDLILLLFSRPFNVKFSCNGLVPAIGARFTCPRSSFAAHVRYLYRSEATFFLPAYLNSKMAEQHMNGTDLNRTVKFPSLEGLRSAKSTHRLDQIARVRAKGVGDHISLPQLVE
ncbi:hypothetical protein DL98DRAFT_93304 [Cadophora sp. DSE1049]|nr:hypothetical protein DL98DRAFT_93304 [Cadophora sp. DSE1049]